MTEDDVKVEPVETQNTFYYKYLSELPYGKKMLEGEDLEIIAEKESGHGAPVRDHGTTLVITDGGILRNM